MSRPIDRAGLAARIAVVYSAAGGDCSGMDSASAGRAGNFKFRYRADGQWFAGYAAFGIGPGPSC